MKILTSKQIREADAYTIKNEPISSEDLMRRAANNATEWIHDNLSENGHYSVFAGVGNNGGDGLVIAQNLLNSNCEVDIYIVNFSNKYTNDLRLNLEILKKMGAKINYLHKADDFLSLSPDTIVIDAILGSGLTRPATGFVGEIIEKINNSQIKFIISIDIPSGLFDEENHIFEEQNIIKATFTLTFEFPFLSFLFAENEQYVGEFVVIPIGLMREFTSSIETDFELIENEKILELYKGFSKFSHKGSFGHGLLLAGGYGRMGAAILAAKAAHRAGIGLLTAQVPSKCVDIMQISSPESKLFIDTDEKNITQNHILDTFDALCVGPAIGFADETVKLLKKTLQSAGNKPVMLDADAITIISKNKDWYNKLPKNCIITPHLKEFERLTSKTNSNFATLKQQIEFSKKYKVIIVLKGAFSSISLPSGKVYFNSTGNPGMATAGSGDVLSGIILAFLSMGYKPDEAAVLSVYIHGLAGDFANEKINTHSLIASDIIEYLSEALNNFC